MSDEKRYTLWVESQGPDTEVRVLAAGLTVAEAATLVCEYGNARPYICGRAYGTFRGFELQQYNSDYELLVTIGATVPRTDDIEAVRRNVMKMIDAQTLARHREFSPCRVSTDAGFEERLRKVAESGTVRPLDREIAIEAFNGSIDPMRRPH